MNKRTTARTEDVQQDNQLVDKFLRLFKLSNEMISRARRKSSSFPGRYALERFFKALEPNDSCFTLVNSLCRFKCVPDPIHSDFADCSRRFRVLRRSLGENDGLGTILLALKAFIRLERSETIERLARTSHRFLRASCHIAISTTKSRLI
jgi:hypothetical protein